jgi:hypothetical protein
MSDGGASLRSYLCYAVGESRGFEDLWDFVHTTIEWEDPSTPTGATAAPEAGFVLRRFQPGAPPPLHRMLPDSPRMAQVALFSIPPQGLAPLAVRPWLATPEAQDRIRRMWGDTTRGTEADRVGWRVNYIGNQWGLTGTDIALEDLAASFGREDSPILEFAPEDRTRFEAALRTLRSFAESTDAALASTAVAIRAALANGVQRATPVALADLVFSLRPLLDQPHIRSHLNSLLLDRLHELPDKVRSLLSG